MKSQSVTIEMESLQHYINFCVVVYFSVFNTYEIIMYDFLILIVVLGSWK